jgi:hypothetical protein
MLCHYGLELSAHDRQVFGYLFEEFEEYSVLGHKDLEEGIESRHAFNLAPLNSLGWSTGSELRKYSMWGGGLSPRNN